MHLFLRWADQIAGVNVQCDCQSPEHGYARRNTGAFDRAHVAHAKLSARSQVFLRQVLFMAQTTQIDRHEFLEIHSEIGT